MRLIIGFLLFVISLNSFCQEADSSLLPHKKNSITKLSILSTHPFGIFISRQQGNFKIKPSDEPTLQISLESGNVWSPPVTNYVPNNEAVRNYVSQFPWHAREWRVDVDTLDAETFEIQTDGVIKGLRGNLSFLLGEEHELNLGIRTFLLTKGKFPMTLFTSDDFIEFFHDNLAGGDDPFDRKLYELNKAKIRYKDRNNNVLDYNEGDFIFGGLEASYYYYPKILTNTNQNLHFNFGVHLGSNLSKFNSSIDFGLSANTIKGFKLKNHKKNIQLGLSLGLLRKNIINFDSENIDLGTNDFLAHLESIIEYNLINKKENIHSFGIDFYIQTSFNKKDEYNYVIPTKNGTSTKSWNIGASNLYRNNNYWTFLYSFTKTNTLTVYLQQDFTVNNNPDIQTGIGYTFTL